MTISRKQQISLEETTYYHCMARCVRRAFLCGEDSVSGQNFDHRKQWLEDRIYELASIFSVKICAYAVMSNHYHLVLHVDREAAQQWSDDEVIRRWGEIFKHKTKPSRKSLDEEKGKPLSDADIWRDRLCDISWFMRCLNEGIARKANKEDKCKGRFWEGRFKSQALMDEGALLACMVYVDLNPVRAKLSKTPEDSEFTSIKERVKNYHLENGGALKPETISHSEKVETTSRKKRDPAVKIETLMNFKEASKERNSSQLPLEFREYLELIEWTGKAIKHVKRGSIPANLLPILNRLELKQEGWLDSSSQFESCFHQIAGSQEKLSRMSEKLGVKWIRGKSRADKMYLKSA
ncbi:MAG: transposase [Proteobacteria bacterium]|nr:transposase [Pseudomonadota bacterium]